MTLKEGIITLLELLMVGEDDMDMAHIVTEKMAEPLETPRIQTQ